MKLESSNVLIYSSIFEFYDLNLALMDLIEYYALSSEKI